MENLQIPRVNLLNKITLISIEGDLTVHYLDHFKNGITEGIAGSLKYILFDFNGIDKFDSSGINELMHSYMMKNDSKMVLGALMKRNSRISARIQSLGLDWKFFRIFETLSEALKYFENNIEGNFLRA